MNQNFRNFALWAVILLLLVALFNLFQNPSSQSSASEINYSQFRNDTANGRVKSVVISGQEITGKYEDGTRFRTTAPENADYVTLLEQRGVSIQARADDQKMSFLSVLISWFPMFLLIAVWIFFMRQMQGAGGKRDGLRQIQGQAPDRSSMAASSSKTWPASTRPRRISRRSSNSFATRRSSSVSVAAFPRGVLLVGPPGTGKTLHRARRGG